MKAEIYRIFAHLALCLISAWSAQNPDHEIDMERDYDARELSVLNQTIDIQDLHDSRLSLLGSEDLTFEIIVCG
jgi:hypothetical protein